MNGKRFHTEKALVCTLAAAMSLIIGLMITPLDHLLIVQGDVYPAHSLRTNQGMWPKLFPNRSFHDKTYSSMDYSS